MPHSSQQPLLTVAEVAARLNLNQPRTVRRYIASGRLEAIRLPHGEYRVAARALVEFEAACRHVAGTPPKLRVEPRRRRYVERRQLGQNKIRCS